MSEGITGESSAASEPSSPAAPTSVDEALEQSFASEMTADAAPDAEVPVVDEGDAAPDAAPPAEAAPVAEIAGKEGPIPFPVHKTALENARLKTEQEVTERLTNEWRTQVQPVMQAVQAISNDLHTGSIEGLAQLIAEYEQHPQLGQQVKALWGRKLSQQRGASSPLPPQDANAPEPEADYEMNGTPFYSAPRLKEWQQWNAQQLESRLQQQIQPLAKREKDREHAETLRTMQQTAHQKASAQLAQFESDPDFVAHAPLVKERMAADKRLSLDAAWHQVYRDVVVPKIKQQTQDSFLQQARKKSAGSTTDPAASAPAPFRPKKGMSVDDVLNQSFG